MGSKKKLHLGLILGLLIATSVFIGGCVPATGGEEGGFDWTLPIFLVLIFGLMYFVMIRPQRKRQKDHQQLVQELQKGDRVVTAGGIYGVVDNISDDNVCIKVESGAIMRVAKGSVALKQEQ